MVAGCCTGAVDVAIYDEVDYCHFAGESKTHALTHARTHACTDTHTHTSEMGHLPQQKAALMAREKTVRISATPRERERQRKGGEAKKR
jgi:hypothetical protein